MRALIVLLAAGCGRVQFEPVERTSECPDGYVFVAGNSALGTSEFETSPTATRASMAST